MRYFTSSNCDTVFVHRIGYGPSNGQALEIACKIAYVLETPERVTEVYETLTGTRMLTGSFDSGLTISEERAINELLDWWWEIQDSEVRINSYVLHNLNAGRSLVLTDVGAGLVDRKVPFKAPVSRGLLPEGDVDHDDVQ